MDSSWADFKVINFRPWLAIGKNYELLESCQNDEYRNLSKETKLKLAKSRDLFCFGEALYDMMMNKTGKEEQFM